MYTLSLKMWISFVVNYKVHGNRSYVEFAQLNFYSRVTVLFTCNS